MFDDLAQVSYALFLIENTVVFACSLLKTHDSLFCACDALHFFLFISLFAFEFFRVDSLSLR